MPTVAQQLYSQTHYTGMDGVTTVWDFTFSGGYIDKAHVKAYYIDGGVATPVVVTVGMFLGPFQLQISSPPIPATATRFVIYRDTPKDQPLVDFGDGAQVSEPALDLIARQAVFVAAEVLDGAAVTTLDLADLLSRLSAVEGAVGVGDDYGFRELRTREVTGTSPAVPLNTDNGKGIDLNNGGATNHLSLPASVAGAPNGFTFTVTNRTASAMNFAVNASANFVLNNGTDTPSAGTGGADITLPAYAMATITMRTGTPNLWYINGPVS